MGVTLPQSSPSIPIRRLGDTLVRKSSPRRPPVPLATGDKAPDFILTDTDGQDVSLSSFQGRQNVLLVFYCRNNTPG